jgi:hypothetical protein
MNYVVIQLRHGRHTAATLPVFWVLLIGHAFVVGLPIALIARGARDSVRQPAMPVPATA